jgi:hypothetical protein
MKKLIITALLLSPSLALGDTLVVCPEDYPTSLLTTKGVPAGWNGVAHVTGLRLVLTSAGVLVGPPDREIQSLLRGEEKKTKTGYTVRYFDLTRFNESKGVWVFCAYGMGGDVQLLQRLPDNTDACMVEATRNFQHGHDIRVTCRTKP